MLLISACLLGINCRYDGSNCKLSSLIVKALEEIYIPFCPEQLGGLSTPRSPIFLTGGDGFDLLDFKCKAIDEDGIERTFQLIKGAEEALKIAQIMGIKKAIMKEKSPSCGVKFTRSFKELLSGPGVTTALFIREGIYVISEESLLKN